MTKMILSHCASAFQKWVETENTREPRMPTHVYLQVGPKNITELYVGGGWRRTRTQTFTYARIHTRLAQSCVSDL